MTSARATFTTATEGSGGGTEFNDGRLLDLNTAIVTRIVITVEGWVRSIAVHYAGSVGVARGRVASDMVEITLNNHEFITTVEGSFYGNVIAKIAFETSEGRKLGPYGQVLQSTTFAWGGFGPGIGFLYFDGSASSAYINALRATFAKYPTSPTSPARPAMIKYEKHITTGLNTLPLSHFATNLMSPTITLLIGPDSIVFQTSQEILCRLQFFRAALEGGFAESSSRTINMPEDEPQTIAALIEFLYTGSYSYPYHTTSDIEVNGVEVATPAVELAEGEYHVSVYATAHKYGCTMLEGAALQGFIFVLRQLKGVDILHLWRSAYANDLHLSAVEDEVDLAEFSSGLPGLLKEIFLLHPTEMETASADFPTLVHDMLRLVVCKE